MKNNINLNTIKKYVSNDIRKKSEVKTYILEVLHERLSLLDERTEQEWIDANDPKALELKLLYEAIVAFG